MSGAAGDLEDLYDPRHTALVRQRHQRAFAWEPQGWIPLGIHVVNPEHMSGLEYERWLEPEHFFTAQYQVLRDTLAVGSDLLPVVGINHLGDAVVSSMLGAEQFMPETMGVTLQDVGPAPLPVFSSIEQVTQMEMPSLDAGIVPQVERFLTYYRQKLPGWVHVVAPSPTGPFTMAMMLRGSDFLLDLKDNPQLCHKLIEMCTRLQIQVELNFRGLTGESLTEHVTNFGVLGVGLRLGEDSIVNLSPSMIHEFCLPVFNLVNSLCGGVGHIHFCSLIHSRFEHIYPALAATEQVAVVSSQFGWEYYQEHLEELRGRLAVESFYGDSYGYVCRKYGSFRAWAEQFVPRFKNESGLVLYCQVESVEEGRRVWESWQQAHQM